MPSSIQPSAWMRIGARGGNMNKSNKGGARLSSTGRLLSGASMTAIAIAIWLPASAAFAQVAQQPSGDVAAPSTGQVQEVVVTGSRISQRNNVSNSPIVTLQSAQLMSTADLQIQNVLNKLPQFSPDQNLMGAASGDVQATPTHSVGITTASLRGLGPNRNLVLIDGQRATPVNASLVIDLSAIPTAMIDHVEAITGGASAVYGADAIGGVVNFIMKKNFQGLDLDMQTSINQTGDGKAFQASAVMGTNFADDKGNVTVALERFQQDASLIKDHKFYTKGWNDPTVSGNGFFPFATGFSGSAFAGTTPSPAAISAVLGSPPGAVPTTATFWINNGGVFTGNSGFGAQAPIYGAAPAVNGSSISNVNQLRSGTQTVVQLLKDNQTVSYIQSPLDRWSMLANGHYDINEWVTATFMADFSQTTTNTLLAAPASFITGWTVYVPYDAATNGVASGHPVPAGMATLLNSRANPNAPWALSYLPSINGPLDPRGSAEINTQYQIRAGLKGKFPEFAGRTWTWELNSSHSQSMEYMTASGDYSLQRFQALITSPNYGANSNLHGNFTQPNGAGGTILSPNFGFGMGNGTSCTSGFYNTLFNNQPLSKDCQAAITAPLQSMDITKQDVVEYNMAGDLFKLPAGMIKANFGADYRRSSNVFNPDILQSTSSFIDQVVGVYPEPALNVSQDVKEGYGELVVPILAGLPFIKSLTFNPGLRYSSYNTSKGGYTYKLLADMEVNDYIRLRGGYNLAVRAPNLGELFQGPNEFFGGGSSYGDACSLLSTAPYGAGGAATTLQGQNAPVVNKGGLAGAQNALAICKSLMTKAGGQPAVDAFYNTVGTNQPNPGPSPFAFVSQSGNPNLLPETAKTYTAGIQLRSPFQNPLFSRANLSIDYYKIHIDNAIEFASLDYVYQNCLNQPAAGALSSLYCQAVSRSPQSGADGLDSTPEANLATIDTSGVDVQFDWSIQLSDLKKDIPGRFSVNVVGSILGNYDTTSAPGFPVQKWYGTAGPTLAGTNGGSYAYKLNTSFGYSVGPASFNLNWRHLPQLNSAGSIAAGNTTQPAPAYDIFDLATNWSLPHALQLRVGVQNLFDVDPAITGRTVATQVLGTPVNIGSSGQGTTNSGYYDPFGRRFYVGLKARF
jgi:iron complex outermembrane receptor protein